MIDVVSPLTNSTNVELIKVYKVSEIVERWEQEFGISIINEFDDHIKTISLYRCLDSELVFFEPKVEGSSKIYKELQNKFAWYYLEDKWEYKIAQKELKNAESIIEIGSGKGTFIDKILKINKAKIIGFETSEEAVLNAAKKKLPVYLNDYSDFLLKNKDYQFDAILSFQVLEHISDPLNFLKSQVSYMKKGCKLILCVPNIDCFYKYSDELLDMPPHHATKWSKNTFQYLEKILPIRLKKIHYEPLHELHINIWIRNYSTYYRQKKWYGRIIFNKITIPILKKILNKRQFRKLIKGHTIYVSFERK